MAAAGGMWSGQDVDQRKPFPGMSRLGSNSRDCFKVSEPLVFVTAHSFTEASQCRILL